MPTVYMSSKPAGFFILPRLSSTGLGRCKRPVRRAQRGFDSPKFWLSRPFETTKWKNKKKQQNNTKVNGRQNLESESVLQSSQKRMFGISAKNLGSTTIISRPMTSSIGSRKDAWACAPTWQFLRVGLSRCAVCSSHMSSAQFVISTWFLATMTVLFLSSFWDRCR